MNEPKKRGRPSKADVEAKASAMNEVWLTKDGGEIEGMADAAKLLAPREMDEFARRQAQAYARRVWDGQSISLTRHERLGRIADALKAQGMTMEGVEL